MNKIKELPREIFEKERKKKTDEIERDLERFLPTRITLQKTIADAMRYSLMGSGKRLRPMFMKEVYELFGGTEKEVISRFMASMEMIHTYSLVHDDLPAMDNDDFRRGRKTTHRIFGEDMGILCGDALLNYAYETALDGIKKSKNPAASLEALSILAKKAGVFGMVGGQVVDVELTGKPLEKEQLFFIYHLKTGALLEASLMLGAALAGAKKEHILTLEKIGECLGMAFQIQDDILDLTSTTEELGKPVYSDEKNDKTTYVSIFGMDTSKKAVENYSVQAMELFETLVSETEIHESEQTAFLYTLFRSLIDRKK